MLTVIADKFIATDTHGILVGTVGNHVPKNHSPILNVNDQIASLPNDCEGSTDIVLIATELGCKVDYNGTEVLLQANEISQTLLHYCTSLQRLDYTFIIKEHSAWFRIPLQVLKWWQQKLIS